MLIAPGKAIIHSFSTIIFKENEKQNLQFNVNCDVISTSIGAKFLSVYKLEASFFSAKSRFFSARYAI